MSKRTCIGPCADFPVGELRQVGVNGIMIVVAQVEPGRFCAALDECAHMVLPLSGGRLDGCAIVCPHHASAFDLCTGENLDWVRKRNGIMLPKWARRLLDRGQAPPPITPVRVIVEGDRVFVEL